MCRFTRTMLAAMLLCFPPAGAEEPNAASLEPIKLADDVTHWQVMAGGDIVIMLREDGLYARSLSVGKEWKLAAMDEKHPVRPRALSHFVRQVGPTSLGFRSLRGRMGLSPSEYTLVDLRNGRQSVVLQGGGVVVPVPVDANTVALLQNVGATADGNDAFLRAVKVNLGSHEVSKLFTLKGSYRLHATKRLDKTQAVRFWLGPAGQQPDSVADPNSTYTQVTLHLDGKKPNTVKTVTPDQIEGAPPAAPMFGRRPRTRRKFISADGKSSVRWETNGRVLLVRGTFEADLFGKEEYNATVMPNRREAPTWLAIIQRIDGERQLYVLSLKTMGKSRLATLGEMDTVKGWACNGRYLIVEEFARDRKDDHGHLVIHEPAKFRKTTLTPPEGRKYINLLGSAGDRFLVLGADLYYEEAIRGSRLYLCDVEDGRRMYRVYEGKLFKIAEVGGKLLFSDFDGESQTFTLYRCPLPRKKKPADTDQEG
ncbi:MAG: hypothetical protein ACLFV7_12240 [Phycisphaerae bacterium]